MLLDLQGVCIEDIPSDFEHTLTKSLPVNGGNVIAVECDSPLGKWLASIGFVFNMPRKEGVPKTWAWIVIFR